MHRGTLLLNRLGVKYLTIQDCHETYYRENYHTWSERPRCKVDLCCGNLVCLTGGDEEVYSPEEFGRIKPAGDKREKQIEMLNKRRKPVCEEV